MRTGNIYNCQKTSKYVKDKIKKDDVVLEYEKKIMGSEYAKQFVHKIRTQAQQELMFELEPLFMYGEYTNRMKHLNEFKKKRGLK